MGDRSLDIRVHLELTANLVDKVRTWIRGMGAVEVTTPILNSAVLAHPTTVLFETSSQSAGERNTLYLQPSPELAMRSLISQGAGPIFQICKAFRDEPSDATHSPEFNILEWYAPGLSYNEMASEVCRFLAELYQLEFKRMTCEELFQEAYSVNLHDLSAQALSDLYRRSCAGRCVDFQRSLSSQLFDELLDKSIERHAQGTVLCIEDYPIIDPCFGKRSPEGHVMRFEIYVQGTEVANGYQEIEQAEEFLARFDLENDQRAILGMPRLPMPNISDVPPCSGVAIGLDRLLARAMGHDTIQLIEF